MKRHLPEEYKRRAIVETVHSVLKRKSGSFVWSRVPEVAEKEIALNIIAYNIRRTVVINNSIFILVIYRFSIELFLTKSLKVLVIEYKLYESESKRAIWKYKSPC